MLNARIILLKYAIALDLKLIILIKFKVKTVYCDPINTLNSFAFSLL